MLLVPSRRKLWLTNSKSLCHQRADLRTSEKLWKSKWYIFIVVFKTVDRITEVSSHHIQSEQEVCLSLCLPVSPIDSHLFPPLFTREMPEQLICGWPQSWYQISWFLNAIFHFNNSSNWYDKSIYLVRLCFLLTKRNSHQNECVHY